MMLPWIGQSICSYGSKLWQNKVIIVDFKNITKDKHILTDKIDKRWIFYPLDGCDTSMLNFIPCWITQNSLGESNILQTS